MANNNKSVDQTNIFSMFDIHDEYAEQKKREEEERKKKAEEAQKQLAEARKSTATHNSSSSKTTKKEEYNLNLETQVFFYTQQSPITDYFSVEEITNGLERKDNDTGEISYKKIDEAEVKKRLKKSYPVMDAGAMVVFLEKKNILSIILQGKKKGNCRSESIKEEPVSTGSSSPFMKIPFIVLQEFIAVSKKLSDDKGIEVHGDIYFHPIDGNFSLDIPQQLANPVWVVVTEEPEVSALKAIDNHWVKIMEIHSHHTMQPFPSQQDNESERGPLLYAIVGNIQKFFPDITVRTFDMTSQKHVVLDAWKIFESPFTISQIKNDLSVVEVVK